MATKRLRNDLNLEWSARTDVAMVREALGEHVAWLSQEGVRGVTVSNLVRSLDLAEEYWAELARMRTRCTTDDLTHRQTALCDYLEVMVTPETLRIALDAEDYGMVAYLAAQDSLVHVIEDEADEDSSDGSIADDSSDGSVADDSSDGSVADEDSSVDDSGSDMSLSEDLFDNESDEEEEDRSLLRTICRAHNVDALELLLEHRRVQPTKLITSVVETGFYRAVPTVVKFVAYQPDMVQLVQGRQWRDADAVCVALKSLRPVSGEWKREDFESVWKSPKLRNMLEDADVGYALGVKGMYEVAGSGEAEVFALLKGVSPWEPLTGAAAFERLRESVI